nr:MAG TPA: hypothetical protein [Caudoviricetes sp.]
MLITYGLYTNPLKSLEFTLSKLSEFTFKYFFNIFKDAFISAFILIPS